MSSDHDKVPAQAPHVVVIAFPTQGHIIPAIQFSKTLVSEGFIVTFVCAEHRIAKIRKAQGEGLSPSIRLIGIPDTVPLQDIQIDEGANSFMWTSQIASGMAPAFEQIVNGLIKGSKQLESSISPPLCIISDFFVSWSQDIANKLKIPRYVFYPSPSAHLDVALYLPRLIEKGIVPVAPGTGDILIPGRPPLKGSELPWDWQQTTPKEVQEFSLGNFVRLHESAGILVNSFYELEADAIGVGRNEVLNPNKVPIYPIGPLLPSELFSGEPIDRDAFSETHSECLKWLDAQEPSSVLYISFGSVAILSIHQIQEIAKALDACHQAFLWILRLPPATESTEFLKNFLSRRHSRGLIIFTWAPQLLILSHPSTGGFMSHCGWNSILESICCGVPILPLPQFAEQFLNSRLVTEDLKVALNLRLGKDAVAESGDIEVAVRKLLQGEEGRAVRSKARAIKEEAARAMAEGGSSHTALHAFIQAATSTTTET